MRARFLIICTLCGLIFAGTVVASEATDPAFDEVMELYRKGDVTTARKKLETYVKPRLHLYNHKPSFEDAFAVEGYLASSDTNAMYLIYGLKFEKRYVKDNPLPETLLELAEKVVKSLNEAIKRVMASPYAKDKRVVRNLDYTKRQRIALLVGIITACRNGGNHAALKRFVSENAVFLKENGVKLPLP